MKKLSDYVRFNDARFEKKWANRPIPMVKLYEAYFNGTIDIPGDINELLNDRNDLVTWNLTTDHLKWIITNFLPEVTIHSKAQDKRIVREHYDRGNDFFSWFLGPRMIYTSGFYSKDGETLENAQDNKLNLVCQKLQLKPGDRLLDIGCGWGTLARHAAKHYGVDATGVTLSVNQAAYAAEKIKEDGTGDRCRVLCMDYREIPMTKYDKIVSLEMVEHVGVKNLKSFYQQCHDMLTDEGIFLLQWTGLRRAMRPEDLIWGLFMNKFIFPGADASLCASAMQKYMEKVEFEIHSVENVTIHYSKTIQAWHKNWMSNKADIIQAYSERWYRIWHFFLAWSVRIAAQGNAACFQVVLNRNLDQFDRKRWIGQKFSLGERAPSLGPSLTDTARPRPELTPSL